MNSNFSYKIDIPSKLFSVGMMSITGFYVEEAKIQKKVVAIQSYILNKNSITKRLENLGKNPSSLPYFL